MTTDESAPAPLKIDSVYSGEPTQLLEGVQAIRKRPGMYIGDTEITGLHHLFKEILNNSIDEVMAGHCDRIRVVIGKDRSITVEDNGRGIPVDYDELTGKTWVTMVMTDLHAGGKFGECRYRTSGGLHGVGASCVNALAEWMETTVFRDGAVHRMRCERGLVVSPLNVIGACPADSHGTIQRWLADRSIFAGALDDAGELDLRSDCLLHDMQQLAFLNPEVTLTFVDELHDAAPIVLHHPDGAAEFVAHLNADRGALHDVMHLRRERGGMQVEIALQYDSGDTVRIDAFVNNVFLRDGGTHVTGFKGGLTGAVNQFAFRNGLLRRAQENFAGEDIRSGLTAVVSLRLDNPMFNSPDKSRLTNTEVEGAVRSVVADGISACFRDHPDTAREIIGHITHAAETRERGPKLRAVRSPA